ncbi:MAG: cell division protein CrgA [Microthrixaceae bacterium]
MATTGKRKAEADQADTGSSTSSSTGSSTGSGPSSGSATKSKRVTPPKAKKDASSTSRYTPPVTKQNHHRPSPKWVPALMFGAWGLGLLVIILNYMQVLPGTESGGNGWYLVAGLGSILAGIMVATQYR